ncbi:MAG: DUF1415 domain-containing protein [Methylococcales bacterium]|nr:DUF1415 domain-containing protein [Methylococcales bacterium]
MNKQAQLQTENWLNKFIIAHNICPFAQAVVTDKSLYYAVDNATDSACCLQQLIIECERLDNQNTIETTLLIYTNTFKNFEDFLDYVDLANALLEAQNYEGVYQLASFHPDYCFADVDETDASNYTNRSPFPMLHLIREASIEKVLDSYPNPESIPVRNIALTRSLGVTTLKTRLSSIQKK